MTEGDPALGRLLHDLDKALDITDAGERTVADHVGSAALSPKLALHALHFRLQAEHIVAVYLPHVGAQQLGEQAVALPVVAVDAAIQHHHDVQTGLARRGRALARMVGLAHAATPHEGVAPLLQGVGHLELELAILVAAQGAVRQVVTLDEHPRPPNGRPQVGQLLERRGQVREMKPWQRRNPPAQIGHRHRHRVACPHTCGFSCAVIPSMRRARRHRRKPLKYAGATTRVESSRGRVAQLVRAPR